MQVAPASQPEHAIAQTLSLEQDHDDEHDYQPHHCQRLKQRSDDALDDLQRFELRPLDFNRYRLSLLDRRDAVAQRYRGLGFGLL